MKTTRTSWVAGVVCAMLLLVGLAASAPAAGFLPTDVTGNVLWLDASDAGTISQSGGIVSQWTDKSTAAGGTVTVPGGSTGPQTGVNTLGGKNVLTLNGTTTGLRGNAVLTGGDNDYTYFAVWKPTATGNYDVFEQNSGTVIANQRAALLAIGSNYGFNGQNNDRHDLVPYTGGAWRLTALSVNNALFDGTNNVRIHDNGAKFLGRTGDPSTVSVGTGGISVGYKLPSNDERLSGNIAELIVYNNVLTDGSVSARDNKVNDVNYYLQQKWGLSTNLLPTASLVHQWKFNNGTANDSVGTANGTLTNSPAMTGGKLVLNPGSDQGQYMTTSSLGASLGERTIMAWVALSNLGQGGGAAALGVQAPLPEDNFDSIVYAERTAGQWMNGSSFWQRSVPNNGGPAENTTKEVMMTIVYGSDNSIKLYRNGVRYDTGANAGTLQIRNDPIAVLGRRISSAGPSLQGSINEARIYNFAMTDSEIASVWSAGIEPTGLTHKWTFNDGTANDSVGTSHGTLYNGAALATGGRLALDGINDYMRTPANTESIQSRTLVAWVQPANLTQQSGSVLSLENAGDRRGGGDDYFDGIVYGERTAGQWMNGSDFWSRSDGGNNGGAAETSLGEVMMAITYDANGANQEITLYRDGVFYASYTTTESTFPPGFSDFLLGLRHEQRQGDLGTAGGDDAFWAGLIDEARVYDHALTASEMRFLFNQGPDPLGAFDPIPEPATMALLGLAVAGLSGYIRRRR